jgi:hypothetical protein
MRCEGGAALGTDTAGGCWRLGAGRHNNAQLRAEEAEEEEEETS